MGLAAFGDGKVESARGVMRGARRTGTTPAASIHFGDATGGVAIHYNDPSGENPANVAYVKAQFSVANTNGSNTTSTTRFPEPAA